MIEKSAAINEYTSICCRDFLVNASELTQKHNLFSSLSDEDEVDYEISRSQSDYFNNFCSHSIPTTEYFPIFLLAQGILLVTPHFVWRGLFKGDFDSFFAVSEKLDRLQERSTGDYDPKNFDRVEKLELEFG